MANPSAAEESKVVPVQAEEAHPKEFHVFGPRNVAFPNWREIIKSSWKDENYKRIVIACFIQAVYLLELDRQENRSKENALAPKWWIPYKYKLVQTLIDERDGSIIGAVLRWDKSAAFADLIPIRPSGAPKAILALRGTLLKTPTIYRDILDDLRFLVSGSLKGSVRFKTTTEALKSIARKYGSANVCVAGHSLGAGFALEVGKALAEEGIYVEAHLFNPPSPSLSLAAAVRNVGEKTGLANKIRAMLPSKVENQANGTMEQWVPHLYVNTSDYICCSYAEPDGVEDKNGKNENLGGRTNGQVAPKLFVVSNGKRKFLEAFSKKKFLEAHALEQWWSDDVQLQRALCDSSKLISRQLKSLYTVPSPTQTQGRPS